MMTDTLKRIVWKEYRSQASLWWAILLAGVTLQLAVVACHAWLRNGGMTDSLFTVALSFPLLYTLGCGASLFAGEHESGTFSFQQALPVSASQVFWGKMLFAAGSTLSLFPLLWLAAWWLASLRLPAVTWHTQLWVGGLAAALEVLIWSTLFSLLLRRVLPVAVVSGVVAALLGGASMTLMSTLRHGVAIHEYWQSLPLRIACAAAALIVSIVVARRWFDEHVATGWRSEVGPAASRSERPARVVATTAFPAFPAFPAFVRLMWQTWRQSWFVMLCCLSGYAALVIWVGLSLLPGGRSIRSENAFAGLPILAFILGGSMFWSDQARGQYLFFAEHGVRPRLVWLSRQLSGAAILTLAAFAAFLLYAIAPTPRSLEFVVTAMGVSVIVFSISQLCSLLIRSGIVAIFVAAFCSLLFGFWFGLTHQFGISYLVSCLPLPFIGWFASWLYAPVWIKQSDFRGVRCRTAVSIILPMSMVLVSIAAFRVYEIPRVKPSLAERPGGIRVSASALETLGMYEQAAGILNPLTDTSGEVTVISQRDDEWERGVQLFLTASSSRGESLPVERATFDLYRLVLAMQLEARALMQQGELDAAAEIYLAILRWTEQLYQHPNYQLAAIHTEHSLSNQIVAWAAHAEQTAPRLRDFLTRLDTWQQRTQPQATRILVGEFDQVRDSLRRPNLHDTDQELEPAERRVVQWINWLTPWEHWRRQRLLKVVVEKELQESAQRAMLPPHTAKSRHPLDAWQVRLIDRKGQSFLLPERQIEDWLRATPGFPSIYPAHAANRTVNRCLLWRSALRTQLALLAWRCEHGEFPAALTDLVGREVDKLPLDPFTGQPLVYVREGIKRQVASSDGSLRSAPLLWSPDNGNIFYAPSGESAAGGAPTWQDFHSAFGERLEHEHALLRQGQQFFLE